MHLENEIDEVIDDEVLDEDFEDLVEEGLDEDEVLENGNNILYFYIYFLIFYYEKNIDNYIVSFGIFRNNFFLKI
jgi:hypothetical protein